MKISKHGIESIKKLLAAIFANLKVDQNDDGEISTSEWANAAFQVIPAFVDPNLVRELRDLDPKELRELAAWAKIQFPAISQLEKPVEDVVQAALGVILSIDELWGSVVLLKKHLAEPVVEPVPAKK